MIDVLVVGGGAAGLHAAAIAARNGASVVVLEYNSKPGKKIRISGGGRCNFTNHKVDHHNFQSSNPEFARSALARYTPQHFIELVERHNISWHEKTLGQLFCDGSAQQIIDMLLNECKSVNVQILYNQNVGSVLKGDHFEVQSNDTTFTAKQLIVATGGLSIPSLGASDLGYRIAKHFRVPVIATAPALVPITFDAPFVNRWKGLAGISIDISASTKNVSFRENMLFTHRGMSGPAILQVSTYLARGEKFAIDLLPDDSMETLMSNLPGEKRHASTILQRVLTQRFLETWNDDNLMRPVNTVPKKLLESAIEAMKHWVLTPSGNEGYAKAEVTRGGVDTAYLSSKTMECKNVPGLYFIGEVVDVTGWLGGYNFQWAWSSAFAAGLATADRLK